MACGQTAPPCGWPDATDDKLYAYTLATGARDTSAEFDLASANAKPTGVWSNGTTVWVADSGDDKLFAYTLATGARDTSAEFDLASVNGDPRGMWSDATTIWVADDTDDKVYAYTLATGARDTSEEFDLDSGNADPWGVWSNGATMWVADGDDGKLYAYYAYPPTKVLTATDVATTSATLNLTWHNAAWYYKSATTGQTTCTQVAADTRHGRPQRPHPRHRVTSSPRTATTGAPRCWPPRARSPHRA